MRASPWVEVTLPASGFTKLPLRSSQRSPALAKNCVHLFVAQVAESTYHSLKISRGERREIRRDGVHQGYNDPHPRLEYIHSPSPRTIQAAPVFALSAKVCFQLRHLRLLLNFFESVFLYVKGGHNWPHPSFVMRIKCSIMHKNKCIITKTESRCWH